MGKPRKSKLDKAVEEIANAFGVTEEDVEKAKKNEYGCVDVTMSVPSELRLGQAIVNALSHLHKTNPTIAEDPSTALYYVTNSQLQEAIDRFHKPYGFSNR